jgi:hypothetical protein
MNFKLKIITKGLILLITCAPMKRHFLLKDYTYIVFVFSIVLFPYLSFNVVRQRKECIYC